MLTELAQIDHRHAEIALFGILAAIAVSGADHVEDVMYLIAAEAVCGGGVVIGGADDPHVFGAFIAVDIPAD